MDLQVESDIYEPNIDDGGDYSDYLPTSSKFKNGLRCPCGTRKEHVFDTRSSFSGHIKTKTHLKWISDLNISNSGEKSPLPSINTYFPSGAHTFLNLEFLIFTP